MDKTLYGHNIIRTHDYNDTALYGHSTVWTQLSMD
jgi:hypothetical protein